MTRTTLNTLGVTAALPAALFLATNAAAQRPFLEPTDIAAMPGLEAPITSVDAADFDQDGHLDLLVAAQQTLVLTSLGGGAFAPSVAVQLGLAESVMAGGGDVDGDGDPDVVALVLAKGGGLDLVWSENRGGGDYALQGRLANAPAARSIRVEDIDSDGDGDFVLLLESTFELVWFENTGGAIGSNARLLLIASPDPWRVEDVTGDGINDLINEARQVGDGAVARGLGGGAFAPFVTLPSGPSVARGSFLRDLNGDGLEDVLTAEGNGLVMRPATSTLTFGAPVAIPTPGLLTTNGIWDVIDVDGDGTDDILFIGVPSTFKSYRYWLPGLGGGSYDLPIRLGTELSTNAFPRLVDVTSDGLPDTLRLADGVTIEINQGSGAATLFDGELRIQGGQSSIFSSTDSSDFDGDGDLDVVAVNGVSSELVWFENVGGGNFAPARTVPYSGLPSDLVLSADLDGDGDDDYLLRNSSVLESSLNLLENLGNGQVAYRTELASVQGSFLRIDLVDVDLDGDPDISAYLQTITGTLTSAWFRNEDIGSRFPEINLGTAGPVSFVDVDNDGRVDPVFAGGTAAARTALWRRNLGGGALGAPAIFFFGLWPERVRQADMTGDGIPDLLIQQGASMTILVKVGATAANYFTLPQSVPIVEDFIDVGLLSPSDFEPLDVDLDGDIDVVAYGRTLDASSPRRNVWLNNGSGMLDAESVNGGAFGPGGIAVATFADFDGDQDVDILFAELGVFVTLNGSSNQIGMGLCGPAVPTSAGPGASMSAYGSTDPGGNDLTLRTDGVPQMRFGIYIGSQSSTSPMPVAGSQGRVCLGGSIGRYDGGSQILNSGLGSSFQLRLDTGRLETPLGTTPATPGQTWFFQTWFRDTGPMGAPTSNFSDAVAVTFQ